MTHRIVLLPGTKGGFLIYLATRLCGNPAGCCQQEVEQGSRKGGLGQEGGREQMGLWDPNLLGPGNPESAARSCAVDFHATAPSSPIWAAVHDPGEDNIFSLSPASAAAHPSSRLDMGQVCQLASSSSGFGLRS